MYRIALSTLLLLAGCWQSRSDGPMGVTILDLARGGLGEPVGPSPIQVGPNDPRIGYKSDIEPGATIVENIELDAGTLGELTTLVGDTYTFSMGPFHDFEVNDKIDAHLDVTAKEPYMLRFGMTVTSVVGGTVEATGGIGPRPIYTPRDAVLCKPQDIDVTDFQGKDITKCRIMGSAPCGIRPLTTGDAELGTITVPYRVPPNGIESLYTWSWKDGVPPAWGTSPVYKLRCSNGHTQAATVKIILNRGGPRYRVYKNGQFIYSGFTNWIEVNLDPKGECARIEVLDQSWLGPTPQAYGQPVIAWDTPSSGEPTAFWRIQQYLDSAWTTIREINHTGKTRYQVELPALPGQASAHEFRVTPVGENRNEGTPIAVDVIVKRPPDMPDIAVTYDKATQKFTISNRT